MDQREHGHLHRRQLRVKPQHGALALGDDLLVVGVDHEGEHRAVDAERRLDHVGCVPLLAVDPLELRSGRLGVCGQIEVAAVRDPLELRPAHREEVLEVAGRRRVVRELLGLVCVARGGGSRGSRTAGATRRRSSTQNRNHSSASAGGTKYSISICSNSSVRKMKFPGVISFRNALPTWAMPNGGLRRAIWATFLKLMKMPCAVSGRRNASLPVSSTGPIACLEHEVELAGLGEVALVGLAGMLARPASALRLVRADRRENAACRNGNRRAGR